MPFKRILLVAAVALHYPEVSENGTVGTLKVRRGVPLLSARVPSEVPVRPGWGPSPRYPTAARGTATAFVVMELVVDGTGRAEPATIHDVWPADRPRLTGEAGRYDDAFVAEIRQAIVQRRYRSARIGGCTVRQLVNAVYEFNTGR